MLRIGVDFGGTKIEAMALGEDGQELARKRVPSPRDYRSCIAALVGLVDEVERLAGRGKAHVGVGHPGAIVPATGLVARANSTWLNGMPFGRDLEQALERPTRFSNDANCLAVSEAIDGAAAGHRVVFGVILGTGVGGGVAVDGRVIDGRNGIGGEWGHNPLPWPRDDERPGPSCFCGKTGCIEQWLCGPGLAADHARVTGEKATGPEIVARAEAGDARADATLTRYEDRLARSLAAILNVVDPDAIVLGGGLGQIDRLYRNVPPQFAKWTFADQIVTPVLKPVHGDSSGVRGAAWLWGRS